MNVGIPKERFTPRYEERRVALSPSGARELVRHDAVVYVERGAGDEAGFPDAEYDRIGAKIIYGNEELYHRSDVVVKVRAPESDEWDAFHEGQVLMGFLYLPMASRGFIEHLIERKVSAIGYEIMEAEGGTMPVLRAMSQIAGKLTVQVAGGLLQSREKGRRGILMGGLPGIPPSDVVILGGGNLGYWAAKGFAGIGANVYILDTDMRKLEHIEQTISGRVVTARYTESSLAKFVAFADVLVCAIRTPGERVPQLVTKEMVMAMSPGAVIMDYTINMGGCVETIRLTPREDFVYVEEGIIHFAVPNVPSWVARTSTHALTNSLLFYLKEMIRVDPIEAFREWPALRSGLYTCAGHVTKDYLARNEFPFRTTNEILREVY